MSYLTMPALLGPILGPPIGGFIVTFWSWRWIFFINVPMGVLGVTLATLFIPDVREAVKEKLDVRGFILTGFGLAGLVYGFDNIGKGVLPFAVVAAMLIGGIVCGVLYAFHAKRTPNAILDLSLLKIRTFTASTVGGLFSRLIIGASPFLLALLLQLGFGLSAFQAGLLTFAGAAGALVMKTTARPIINRFGFKRVLIVNAFMVAILSGCYAFFRISTPHWIILLGPAYRRLFPVAAVHSPERDGLRRHHAALDEPRLQPVVHVPAVGAEPGGRPRRDADPLHHRLPPLGQAQRAVTSPRPSPSWRVCR